jgi:hypothetical protein
METPRHDRVAVVGGVCSPRHVESPLARLLGWFSSGALLRPDRDVPSTVDLARALASTVGVPGLHDARVQQITRAVGPAEHLILVLVDGLGLELVESLPASAFLRRHQALELRAVYPSATAAALTSLATGEWPAQHALPGWWTYLPERDLTLTTLPCIERFGGAPFESLGITPAEVFPAAALLARYPRDTLSIQPASIADSTYSKWVRGDGVTGALGYTTFDGGVDAAIDRVRRARRPTYTYLYTPIVDAMAHTHGPDAIVVREAVREIDRAIARLARGLGGRARIVVSADHGLVTVAESRKHVFGPTDDVGKTLRCAPTGEPRAPLFHVRPGAREAARAALEARLGDRFALLDTDEALGLGLFGPLPPTAVARARLGDLVGVAQEEDVVLWRDEHGPTGTERLRGYHGGMLPSEMRIPLVVA